MGSDIRRHDLLSDLVVVRDLICSLPFGRWRISVLLPEDRGIKSDNSMSKFVLNPNK